MPITAAEIAKMCNVSRTTVDRALKGKSGISAETRTRICEVAEKYNYRPNYIASSLSTGKTHTIGVIVFDLFNQHFTEIVDGIERYFSNIGLHTYVCISHKDKEREKIIIQSLVDRKVDGVMIVPINNSIEFSEYLQRLGIPVVCLSNYLAGLPFVSGDNAGGVYMGMQDLYTRGFRNIYFVCPPLRYVGEENIYAQKSRSDGYLDFRKEHPDVSGELVTSPDYLDIILPLIDNPTKPIGIVCSSDIYMLEIYKHANIRENKASNIALVGVDGLWILDHLSPRPSSVFYPAKQIGECGAKLLDDLINGRESKNRIIIPCNYLKGDI